MRVVIDSNVAIAAVASRGMCEALMELCLERHQVVLCEDILSEIRAKLGGKLGGARILAPRGFWDLACGQPGRSE